MKRDQRKIRMFTILESELPPELSSIPAANAWINKKIKEAHAAAVEKGFHQCPECEEGVPKQCVFCSHHRWTGGGGGQALCNVGLQLKEHINHCEKWKKTKKFVSDHNKCKKCNGTGRLKGD